MIHYLKIKNFGPIFHEAVLDFEVAEKEGSPAYEIVMPDGVRLLKLMYIYGANASGKTTFLKALEFLRSMLIKPAIDKSQNLDYEPFLFLEDPYANSSSFELSFYSSGTRHVYIIEFNKQFVLQESLVVYQSVKPTVVFQRTTDTEKKHTSIEFGSKVKAAAKEKDLLQLNTLHNNSVIGAYSKSNVDIPDFNEIYLFFGEVLLGMLTPQDNLTEMTADMVNRIPHVQKWVSDLMLQADGQIAGIKAHDDFVSTPVMEDLVWPMRKRKPGLWDVMSGTPGITGRMFAGSGRIERRIEVMHKIKEQEYILPFRSESSGTKHYFGLAGSLYKLVNEKHVLCIDELESSLHPDLMEHFLRTFLLNATQSQLLITTHNQSLMENEDLARRDALWFSEKQDDGSAQLYSAADFDSTIIRKGQSLIKAYKSGKLGARPNLGSPYLTEE
jgi:AAA15 family ATPase/GTPase